MKPDATKHNPDPEYLESLLEKADMGKRRAAELVGVSARDLRYMRQPASNGFPQLEHGRILNKSCPRFEPTVWLDPVC